MLSCNFSTDRIWTLDIELQTSISSKTEEVKIAKDNAKWKGAPLYLRTWSAKELSAWVDGKTSQWTTRKGAKVSHCWKIGHPQLSCDGLAAIEKVNERRVVLLHSVLCTDNAGRDVYIDQDNNNNALVCVRSGKIPCRCYLYSFFLRIYPFSGIISSSYDTEREAWLVMMMWWCLGL